MKTEKNDHKKDNAKTIKNELVNKQKKNNTVWFKQKTRKFGSIKCKLFFQKTGRKLRIKQNRKKLRKFYKTGMEITNSSIY